MTPRKTPPPLQKPDFPMPVRADPPRFLMLYGSLRETSYSHLLTLEAAKILRSLGAEVEIFDPTNLPIKSPVHQDHDEVKRLLELALWAEGHVWTSPEIHGSMSGVFKNQIDWIPLSLGAIRPTQGRTLAVMQVCGGSQSFNVVNQLRVLGRWMRMIAIPNQSSIAKAYTEFHDDGTLRDSPFRDRVVDVMEELFKFTMMTRDHRDFLVDRYSERREIAEKNAANDLENPKHQVDLKSL